MARIDFSQVTYNIGQIEDLSEIFFDSVFLTPALEQFHTVVTGIKAKKQLIFMGEIGLSGKKQASCDWESNPNVIPQSEKEWSPEYIGDRFEECFIDLLDTYFVWLGGGLKSGVDKPDLTNTAWSAFLEERVGRSATEAALRHAWLGNTAAENVVDGGVIKNGVDIEYFNAIDGFWIQFLQIVAANAAQRITIAKNAGANYAAQMFDAADIAAKTVTNIFNQMIFGADMRLRESGDLQIVCTQSMFDQYILERQSVTNIDLAYTRVEGGISTIQIQGVTVIPFSFLDRMIRTYENNGTKYNNPHRAVFTTKKNLMIGVEETSNISDLDPFYDKKDKKYYVDYAYNLDALVARDYLVMVAY